MFHLHSLTAWNGTKEKDVVILMLKLCIILFVYVCLALGIICSSFKSMRDLLGSLFIRLFGESSVKVSVVWFQQTDVE